MCEESRKLKRKASGGCQGPTSDSRSCRQAWQTRHCPGEGWSRRQEERRKRNDTHPEILPKHGYTFLGNTPEGSQKSFPETLLEDEVVTFIISH